MRNILIGVFSLLMISCTNTRPSFSGDIDRSAQSVETRVYIYKNKREITKAFKASISTNKEKLLGDNSLIDGWAEWTSKKPYKCNIHVIKPRSMGSKNTIDTWGHEMLHCIYGDYHRKGIR